MLLVTSKLTAESGAFYSPHTDDYEKRVSGSEENISCKLLSLQFPQIHPQTLISGRADFLRSVDGATDASSKGQITKFMLLVLTVRYNCCPLQEIKKDAFTAKMIR